MNFANLRDEWELDFIVMLHLHSYSDSYLQFYDMGNSTDIQTYPLYEHLRNSSNQYLLSTR